MPSRREHQKSRHGCPQCKRRKVKCDEKMPECGNCLRSGKQCGFLELLEDGTISRQEAAQTDVSRPITPNAVWRSRPISRNGAGSSSSEASTATSLASSPGAKNGCHKDALTTELRPPTSPSLSLQDLALLHHYTTCTTTSMSDLTEFQHIWRTAVPREGFSHSFLMNAILGLAAAHMACIVPGKSDFHRRRAAVLRNQALNSSLPSFAAITPGNCDALFAFAGIVAISIFALPASSEANAGTSPVTDILDFFALVRGVGVLLRNGNTLAWIQRGDLQLLIEPRGRWPVNGRSGNNALPESLSARLDDLEFLNQQTSHTSAEQQCYESAIRALRTAFETLHSSPDGGSAVGVWPGLMSGAFLTALRDRRPMALTILANYSVLIYRTGKRWLCEARGTQLVDAIHRELPLEWRPAIRWPLEATHSEGLDVAHGLAK